MEYIICKKIKNNNRSNITYIRSIIVQEALIKLIVAYHNTDGGYIVLGVNAQYSDELIIEGIDPACINIYKEEIEMAISILEEKNIEINLTEEIILCDTNKLYGVKIEKGIDKIFFDNRFYMIGKDGKVNLCENKLFISHSLKNRLYGNILVELLGEIGISDKDILYSSDSKTGILNNEPIFPTIRKFLKERAYVIFLVSPEYFESSACLSEMGAVWFNENKYEIIGIPKFNIAESKIKNGPIEYKKVGFTLDDEVRIGQFISQISEKFNISLEEEKIGYLKECYLKKFIETYKNESV